MSVSSCKCLFIKNNFPHPGIDFEEQKSLQIKADKYRHRFVTQWKDKDKIARYFRQYVETADLCGNFYYFEEDEANLELLFYRHVRPFVDEQCLDNLKQAFGFLN